MVHWNGMLGLVRLRMLRAGISKYWTLALGLQQFALGRHFGDANELPFLYFRFLFALLQEGSAIRPSPC